MNTRVVQRVIAADHPALDGHFPGNPVLPGVVLLCELLQAIRSVPDMDRAIGTEPVLVAVKFLAPVAAACCLQIELRLQPGALNFELRAGASVVAKGRYLALPEPAHAG